VAAKAAAALEESTEALTTLWLRFLPPPDLLRQRKALVPTPFVEQRFLEELTGAGVHHGNRLLSCMQIAAYNCVLDEDATRKSKMEILDGSMSLYMAAIRASLTSTVFC
jgi:hypothetical protein